MVEYVWPDKKNSAVLGGSHDKIDGIAKCTGAAKYSYDINPDKILIARALVHAPQALVLDEPSTSLDLRATWELREALRKLASKGISILMVTHHLPDIIPEMRRVVLMREGRIVLDGAKQDVLGAEALTELFGVPVEVLERGGYYHVL